MHCEPVGKPPLAGDGFQTLASPISHWGQSGKVSEEEGASQQKRAICQRLQM